MTIEILLRILNALNEDRLVAYYEQVKNGKKEEARMLLRESMVLDEVRWLITRPDFAEKMCDIYDINLD